MEPQPQFVPLPTETQRLNLRFYVSSMNRRPLSSCTALKDIAAKVHFEMLGGLADAQMGSFTFSNVALRRISLESPAPTRLIHLVRHSTTAKQKICASPTYSPRNSSRNGERSMTQSGQSFAPGR